MKYNPGFNIIPTYNPLGFEYGQGVFGPIVENRTLEAIRQNLMDPQSQGPEIVYSIAMDVGNNQDKQAMLERNLLYGAVTYAKGTIGKEPVRSQGHIHAVSQSCGMSTCEVYEIWSGEAYIYMQQTAHDNPGKCYAVHAKPGDVVIVPPGWAHATIVANLQENLTFGAWCVRDFGFDYTEVRAHQGVAWFPVVEGNQIKFIANENYKKSELVIKKPRIYEEFQIEKGIPIYQQFVDNPDKFLFVSRPQIAMEIWENFIP
ncbi:MAG: glucose-6-phosphate isomerase family protein [Longibaculum muris]|uniref:glucose-6-phosphate isomerase n=1 Tax=Longibaculum muris TaxID=1796628 RepID=A0A4R3Z355_9FIRM|nr:glucose-6-phosphate isomerase family protein [Longibaculum muris]KXU51297.1 glucose-6-phosphate isomerase [Candidatus Stoquefichus sp. KLE1796]MBS5370806.1 glucose-6-phosphate isomerase [Coprobacillus cateniformis]MCR1887636.1 glucose-6-phosphate isomerase [Longibaculum muris]MED9813258.1 glucose-6-phosphate isomerase family protein [Longibaculum muris]TCV99519.1 glucose-6-phosphate isomerase [Longibaculum muris]